MKTLALITLITLITSMSQADEYFQGDLFLKNDKERKSWVYRFHQHRQIDPKTGKVSRVLNKFTTPQGDVVMTQNATFEQGKLKRFEYDHGPFKEEGELEVKNDGLYFSHTIDGETRKRDERLRDDLIIGPTLTPFIQSKWDELNSGRKVQGRFAVFERRETMKFNFKKDKVKEIEGAELMVVKMEITNPLYRFLVNPIYLYFRTDNKRLHSQLGRMPVRYKKGKKWVKQDYYVQYRFSPTPFK